MKTSMGIVLIVVGVILTVVGIVMVSGGNSDANPPAKAYGYAASSGRHNDIASATQSPAVHAEPSSKKREEGYKTTDTSKNDLELQTTPTDQRVESKPKTSKRREMSSRTSRSIFWLTGG